VKHSRLFKESQFLLRQFKLNADFNRFCRNQNNVRKIITVSN
jgi:hypothetical protein